MKKIMIIGATSSIAQETARLFASEGYSFFLVGRDSQKLKAVTDDLKVRGAGHVEFGVLNITEYDRHGAIIDEAVGKLNGLDLALICHGTLPDQKSCESSAQLTRKEFEINCLSSISLLTYLANYFEEKKSGTLAVITSPAGDRGRKSNYVYGAAKGAVSIFLQGLRNRLYKSNVHVITIKPGFVDTPMTKDFEKGLLWSTPQTVAKGIHNALKTGKDIYYVPYWWNIIMTIIKLIPERIFKRLSL